MKKEDNVPPGLPWVWQAGPHEVRHLATRPGRQPLPRLRVEQPMPPWSAGLPGPSLGEPRKRGQELLPQSVSEDQQNLSEALWINRTCTKYTCHPNMHHVKQSEERGHGWGEECRGEGSRVRSCTGVGEPDRSSRCTGKGRRVRPWALLSFHPGATHHLWGQE